MGNSDAIWLTFNNFLKVKNATKYRKSDLKANIIKRNFRTDKSTQKCKDDMVGNVYGDHDGRSTA